MQQMMLPMPQPPQQGGGGGVVGAGVSFAELSAFMNERDDRAEAKAEKARQEAKAQKAEMEAKLEEMEAKLEQQRQQNAKLREQALLREQTQIAALQSRVQALHAAQLLGDEELYRLEDIIVDGGCDIDDGAAGGEGESRVVAQMVALSGRMVADGAFARQLRRKFV